MPEDRIRILVVDDEAAMREVLETRLSAWGYDVCSAATAEEARAAAASAKPDIVLSDVVLAGVSGIDLLAYLKEGDPERPVILVTAYGTVDAAVEAMKRGAEDFLTKPLDYAKLEATLTAARRRIEARRAGLRLDSALDGGAGVGGLVGASDAMRAVFELIGVVAASEAAVIITGESGTGKELAARAIHDGSPRHEGPFVALNAAAIPEGLMESELFGHEKGAFTGAIASRPGCFEQAHKGTLFLDEITEMPAALQPKLLRVLEGGTLRRVGGREDRVFDVRVLAASNRDPEDAVERGMLRRDLYYRLNVFTLALPPLRERGGDLPLLAQHFIRVFNAKHGSHVKGFAGGALERLAAYPWPGNVRELRNVVERGVILAREGWIEATHLPPFLHAAPAADEVDAVRVPAGATAAEAERLVVLETLRRTGNNKAEAARRLGLDVKTVRNKLKAWGVEHREP